MAEGIEHRKNRLSHESSQVFDAVQVFLKTPHSTAPEYVEICRQFLQLNPFENILPLLWFEESQEETGKAIERLFQTSFGAELLREERVVDFVLKGLVSEHDFLQQLALSSLLALDSKEDFIYLSQCPLMAALIGCVLKEEQPDLSIRAGAIIKTGCEKHVKFCELFLSQTDLLLDPRGPFSIAALVAEVAVLHPRGLSKYRRRGCFDDLIARLKGDDILIKLNVLKLLEQLCDGELGYVLVTSSKIMSAMLKSLQDYSFEATGCLRLIAKMAANRHRFSQSGTWNRVSQLPVVLYQCLTEPEASDKIHLEASLAIGAICSLPEEIAKYEAPMSYIAQKIWSSNQDEKVAALHSIAQMLTLKTEVSSEANQMQCAIIGKMGSPQQHGIHYTCELCQRPIDEIRFAAFRLVHELVGQRWGVQIVYSAPGFFEFLMNRNLNDTKLGLEWKYAVLQTLYQNPMAQPHQGVVSAIHYQSIDAYLRKGLVGQPTRAAIDEQNMI